MSDSDPLLAGKQMLVVDDEPLLAYDMAELLELHGARIAGTCMSLDEAIALVDSGESVDCAVLDIQIGDEDIWPCARRLRERGVPFLFVSALCGVRALPDEFAGEAFIGKPLNPMRLRESLTSLLHL